MPLSIGLRKDQEAPLQIMELPAASTAAQKLELAQETEVMAKPALTDATLDQELPFQVSSLPPLSTATQKLELTQETEVSTAPLSILAGLDQ